jgi:hypothetical protein
MQALQLPWAQRQQKPAGDYHRRAFLFSRSSLSRAEQHQNDDEADRQTQQIENDRHSELLRLC